MKKLNLLLALTIAYLSVGCTSYVILFKPPANLDPMPEFSVDRQAKETDEEKQSWSMEAIGLDQKFLSEAPALRGNVNVKVAILSTGIDYNHEDLVGQLVINKNEITEAVDINPSINFKDDDDNGHVDDIVGFDVVDGDGMAFDRHGAGTHVAGIIGARANGYGVRGMLEKVALLPIRYISENGLSDIPKLVRALEIALEQRADVVFVQSIDLPIGGGMMANPEVADIETKMIEGVLKKYAKTEIPIVLGAGESLEDFGDTVLGKVFVKSANVIAVTSVDNKGKLSLLANRGERSVKLAAPGDKILTTAPGNQYKEVRGTAYAAAHVAGAMALAKSVYGENLKLKEHIMPAVSSPRTSTPSDYIDFSVVSGGYLNVPKFMTAIAESQ